MALAQLLRVRKLQVQSEDESLCFRPLHNAIKVQVFFLDTALFHKRVLPREVDGRGFVRLQVDCVHVAVRKAPCLRVKHTRNLLDDASVVLDWLGEVFVIQKGLVVEQVKLYILALD